MRTDPTFAVAGHALQSTDESRSPVPSLFAELAALEEEKMIVARSFAGIADPRWYIYRNQVDAARSVMAEELRAAPDAEALRKAWQDYARKLRGERRAYARTMVAAGYRHCEAFAA